MADFDVTTISGSGGLFKALENFTLETISAGATGVILTLTSSSPGRRVRLDNLGISNIDSSQPGITVSVDGVNLISNKTLFNRALSAGSFCIRQSGFGGTFDNISNILSDVIGYEIVISIRDQYSTDVDIVYSYSEGV